MAEFDYRVKLRTFVYADRASVSAAMSVSSGGATYNPAPDVFFLEGTSDNESIASYATPAAGTGHYTVATGSLQPAVTLTTAGVLEYNSSVVGHSISRISVNADAVPSSRLDFAEIPELAFLEGIEETEHLGVYQLDPTNRWTPGDITNASGWTPEILCALKNDSDDTVVNDAWLEYIPATARLRYKGTAIPANNLNYTVYLDSGAHQSARFRIRILRPSYAYGFSSMPADKIAQYGWTGCVPIDAATVGWSQPNAGSVLGGPVRRQTTLYGRSFTAPRVIYLCGQDFPHSYTKPGDTQTTAQAWSCSMSNKTGAVESTWLYVMGDPNRRPHLYKTTRPSHGKLQMYSESATWMLKNLSLDNIGIFTAGLTSNRKSQTILHKIRQVNANGEGTGYDAIGSGFDYFPFSFPSADRIDATDGSLGTFWHSYITFFEGTNNGGPSGGYHQMYMEGNGTSATFINASRFAGSGGLRPGQTSPSSGSSLLKSIQMMHKVRNTLGSVAPDYDTFASNSDPTVCWAQELLDIKSTTLHVDYNNDWRLGRLGTSGKGCRHFMFRRKRRTAFGADVPQYPQANWNPPVGFAPHSPVPGFSGGPDTFVDDNYWGAFAETDRTSPSNPYSLKHYHSYSTVRLMYGTQGAVLRDDGTHPTEETAQFQHSTILGTHPGWIERSVTFLNNMTYVGFPFAITYELDDADTVDAYENGTGNATRSYYVTFNTGEQGYTRWNAPSNDAKSWSSSLNAKMTALGGSGTVGVPWSTTSTLPSEIAKTVVGNTTSQVLQPLYPAHKYQLGTIATRPELYPIVVIASETDLPPWFLI